MFTEITYHDFNLNVLDKFKNDWFLITAGSRENYNCMTASWGGIGNLWNENVAFLFVRPQRYTRKFIEDNEVLTISLFPKSEHKALALLGAKSGQDTNKIEESGLTPMQFNPTMSFKEADFVLVCKKLYHQQIQEEQMLDESIMKHYPNHDYHHMYIVKIEHIYKKLN